MSIKIGIMNLKGGIGKSTTALNIADQLMCKGKKVCLIDCDSQANSTAVYRANTKNTPSLFDIFFADYDAKQVLQKTDYGYIIPCDKELHAADTMVKVGPNMYKHIKRAIASIEHEFDYLIFDTPPKAGVLLGNVFFA